MKNGKVIDKYGVIKYYLNNKLHREDGPADECINGYKIWYLNDKYHRKDNPAIEWSNGDKEWFLNGKRHREDGPAIELLNGYKEWWLNGKQVNKHDLFKYRINKILNESLLF